MSSARLPLALAVLGLAACAHTPSDSTLNIANARNAAPILVVDADSVPDGFDEHVVMIIDEKGLERARRAAAMDPSAPYFDPAYGYAYGYPAAGAVRQRAATPRSLPTAEQAGIPRSGGPSIRPSHAPQRMGDRTRTSQP